MARLREWLIRFWGTLHEFDVFHWGRPGRSDADLEQELRLHAELAVENGRAGGLAQAMEAVRDQRGLPWLHDLVRDVRHACRLLRRNPVFAGVAIASLAIGIGANGAMFSMADELILRPLPVTDPGAVVTVSAETLDQASTGTRLSYPNYRDLRDASRSFDGLLAYRKSSISFARSRQTVREMHLGTLVSDNFFSVLGVQPALGRTFAPDEGRVPGRDAVVVLGYDFWQNALAGDASILGATVWLNGIDFHVIGVTQARFTGIDPPFRPAFYVPIMMAERLSAVPDDSLENRGARTFDVKGRLKPGVAKARARAELASIWTALAHQYPEANRNRAIAVRGELEDLIRQDPWDTVAIGILMALAAIVLAIACANVANLMLGRGRARSREMAIRLALGVSRSRLFRQLLTESLLLALAGLAIGLGVAYAGIRFLQTIPTSDQIVIAPQLDHRVFSFGLLAAAVSALLFGLAPARQSLKTDLVPGLKITEPGDATGRRAVGRAVGRSLLVIGQIALSMVMLVATGMLLDGFRKAVALNPGFRTDHLIMISTDTSLVRYPPAQTHAFYRDLVDRARALPGVRSTTLTSSVPFKVGDEVTEAVIPEGYQFPQGQDHVSTSAAVVDEHYFGTMQIALVRGRAFTAADTSDSRRVAIVNEEFAKTYWPDRPGNSDGDPIGKRLRVNDQWLEIVGIAKTGKYTWIAETPMPFLYLPFAQHEQARMSLLAETNADPALLAAPLREAVRTLDGNQPVFDVQTFGGLYYERAIAVPRMLMQLVGTMGLVGLTLALIGLYALVAYSVARRTREIGIRMAVGAGRWDVLRMVLRQGLLLSIVGIAVGGVACVAVARILTAALAGIGTPSPATYVVVPAALVGLTLAASYLPARRASRVDPLVALRCD
jgi:putative ABC transport system permease protein